MYTIYTLQTTFLPDIYTAYQQIGQQPGTDVASSTQQFVLQP